MSMDASPDPTADLARAKAPDEDPDPTPPHHAPEPIEDHHFQRPTVSPVTPGVTRESRGG